MNNNLKFGTDKCVPYKFGMNPIKFLNIDYIGDLGKDWFKCDYYLSKLSTQNILYSCYHEGKTIEEISDLIGMQIGFIADEISFLEKNAFIIKNENNKYVTNFLMHDLSPDIQEEKHKIFNSYVKLVCDKYIIPNYFSKNKTDLMSQIKERAYLPKNDNNFFLYSLITFACNNLFSFPVISEKLSNNFIRRDDGSLYNLVVSLQNLNQSYTSDLYKFLSFKINTLNPQTLYPLSVLLYSTYYDSREDDWIRVILHKFIYLYDFLVGRIALNTSCDNTNKNIHTKYSDIAIKGLLDNGLLVKDEDGQPYVNIIVSKLTPDELKNLLPPISDDFLTLNNKLADEIYEISYSQYPSRLQNMFRDVNKQAFVSGDFITRVLEYLVANNFLKPLTDMQKKSVNIIMFTDFVGNAGLNP